MVHQSLRQKALATLQANLNQTEEGEFIAAGGHQFRTFWTRDFCFSVPGLLQAEMAELVQNQLKFIHQHKNPEGLLPRGLDRIPPQFRVVWNTFFRGLPPPLEKKSKKLEPEYFGEHGTPAFDSNLHFLRSLFLWSAHTKFPLFLTPNEIEEVWKYYGPDLKDGLLHQPQYSDWQDSAKRKGVLLHTQLLHWEVLNHFHQPEVRSNLSDHLKKWPKSDDGLYFETREGGQISLDSHCLLLKSEDLLSHREKKSLYEKLIQSPLWKEEGLPGRPVHPPHAADQVSWTCKAVGLRHYHDGFHWGWLIAEAAGICYLSKDFAEGDRLLNALENSLEGPYCSEVYELKNEKLEPIHRPLYKSENPFTWTAAKILEALSLRENPSR